MRYPFDQRRFRRMAEAHQRHTEHLGAAQQLRDAGAAREALAEVELSQEAYEEWELLGEELT